LFSDARVRQNIRSPIRLDSTASVSLRQPGKQKLQARSGSRISAMLSVIAEPSSR
jgi:hypothetical protein